jgi:hypothetical protein
MFSIPSPKDLSSNLYRATKGLSSCKAHETKEQTIDSWIAFACLRQLAKAVSEVGFKGE